MKIEEAWDQVEHNHYNKLSNISMNQKANDVIKNLFNEGDDFAFEKTKNYCFIYLENFKIMIHRYDDKCELLVFPKDDYNLTTDDMLFFERVTK